MNRINVSLFPLPHGRGSWGARCMAPEFVQFDARKASAALGTLFDVVMPR